MDWMLTASEIGYSPDPKTNSKFHFHGLSKQSNWFEQYMQQINKQWKRWKVFKKLVLGSCEQ